MNIAFVSNKGGTGKTFCAVHTAWALATRHRVCLVDTDYSQFSAYHWITGGENPAGVDKPLKIPGYPAFTMVCCTREGINKANIQIPSDTEFVIFDGRPEPNTTAAVITKHLGPGDLAVIPIEAHGVESLRQALDLKEAVKEAKSPARLFAVINKVQWGRVSPRARRYLENLGFALLGWLPYSDYVTWSETEGRPIWALRGGKRCKAVRFFALFARYLERGLT